MVKDYVCVDIETSGIRVKWDKIIEIGAINQKLKFDKMGIDTLKIARKTLKGLESRGLEYLCNYYGIADENHHRAFNDAEVTSKLYNVLMEKFGTGCPGLFEPYQLVFKAKKIAAYY